MVWYGSQPVEAPAQGDVQASRWWWWVVGGGDGLGMQIGSCDLVQTGSRRDDGRLPTTLRSDHGRRLQYAGWTLDYQIRSWCVAIILSISFSCLLPLPLLSNLSLSPSLPAPRPFTSRRDEMKGKPETVRPKWAPGFASVLVSEGWSISQVTRPTMVTRPSYPACCHLCVCVCMWITCCLEDTLMTFLSFTMMQTPDSTMASRRHRSAHLSAVAHTVVQCLLRFQT